jgi:predicted nucleic acid-binding protein
VVVIADASPLRYLILIEHTHILPALYGRILVPPTVITELSQEQTPGIVQGWIANRPDWLQVQGPTRELVGVEENLGAGELAAIALAEELSADALIIDERDGRREAVRRGLAVLGTLRVLADAAEHGLADLPAAFDRLRQTNFRASEPLLQSLLARDAARRRTP